MSTLSAERSVACRRDSPRVTEAEIADVPFPARAVETSAINEVPMLGAGDRSGAGDEKTRGHLARP